MEYHSTLDARGGSAMLQRRGVRRKGTRMAHTDDDKRKLLDWEKLEVPEQLPSFSYVLTQEMVDEFRKGVMDPEAAFPTISHKVDVRPYHVAYRDNGSVNARCAFYCYNAPIP